MSKSRSLYDNPYKYACVCSVPLKLAKIACKKQRHLEKEQKKHPCRCPACGSKHLYYEHGSYEEGYGDFVECTDCGETYDPGEIPNIEYGSLTPFEDFDPVIYFSLTENKLEGWKEACGAETHEEWIHFAEKMIAGRILSEDASGSEVDTANGSAREDAAASSLVFCDIRQKSDEVSVGFPYGNEGIKDCQTQCVDKLEQAMQSADFWVELADTSFGKVVLHGKNADRDTGEYYEVSSEINKDGDFAITFFKTYNKMKKWFNDWQGEGFYEYLVELYEKQLTQ